MPQYQRAIPTRTLPDRPDIEQLKKQAKDLLKSFQAGESGAIGEVRTQYHEPAPEPFQLSDAQLVIARAYGFDSWPKLKAFVDGVTIQRFLAAVQRGDLEAVRAMLRQRPELVHMDAAGDNEHRALHYAVLRRDAAMVRLLMEAGADARKGIFPHRDATSAFAIARDREYHDIVAVIETEEQRRRAVLSCPNSSVSPLQDQITDAIRARDNGSVIEVLQRDESLIRACDRNGATLLHVAAEEMNTEIVASLLARGASVNKRDMDGFTPLDRAAMAADPHNDAAQHFPAVAKLLLDRGADMTIRAALGLGNAARLRDLVNANPGVLREITWRRGGLLSLAVNHGRLEIIRLLLDLGADVDERTMLEELEEPTLSWGRPLWCAALAGRRDIAELLLDRGADPNANVYASGWPLRNAYQRNDEDLTRLLIERGAKPTPYMAAEAGDVEQARRMLERDNSDDVARELAWSAADHGRPAVLDLALPRLTWRADDPRWHWILIQPVRGIEDDDAEAFFECMAMLLRHGVDPNVSSRFGQTTLHFTAAREAPRDEQRIRFASMLLDHGARLDVRDDLLRSTPLGWACRWGRTELVQFLIARGAPVNEPDAEPWATPIAWAGKMHHAAIERLLTDAGAL